MDHRQQLVDLAARCRLATDVEALVVDFLTLIRCFGFAAAAAGGWIGAGRTLAYRFYFNDWPPSWAEFYSSNDVFLDDPLVNETQQRISPFLWTEIEEMSDRHRNVIRMAGDYGWSNGFVVPVHGPAGYHGMISLAAMQPLDLAQDDRVLLWTASLAVHDRCRTSPNLGQNASHVPQLSAREVRMLSLGYSRQDRRGDRATARHLALDGAFSRGAREATLGCQNSRPGRSPARSVRNSITRRTS